MEEKYEKDAKVSENYLMKLQTIINIATKIIKYDPARP